MGSKLHMTCGTLELSWDQNFNNLKESTIHQNACIKVKLYIITFEFLLIIIKKILCKIRTSPQSGPTLNRGSKFEHNFNCRNCKCLSYNSTKCLYNCIYHLMVVVYICLSISLF